MEFQWNYFKSWKMMLWKCCTEYASKFGKLSSGHRTGKGQFSFQSQRKAMSKNAQTTPQLHSGYIHTSKQESLHKCRQVKSKVKVLAAQSCPTLCNPMDCSPPSSSVHGILQAIIPEWVAIPFSRETSQPRDQTWVSCIEGRFLTGIACKWSLSVMYVLELVLMCKWTDK